MLLVLYIGQITSKTTIKLRRVFRGRLVYPNNPEMLGSAKMTWFTDKDKCAIQFIGLLFSDFQ
ncbi:hypothetical protein FC650_03065 [Vibrio natriegens]|nr:hypothetical protein [Vibrio natriegens]